MTVKLTELYNTKFFYITTGKDLTYLFTTCASLRANPELKVNAGNNLMEQVFSCFRVGAPVTFDLADGRFTSDVTHIILTAQRDYKMDIIDSVNIWRNDILAENKRRIDANDAAGGYENMTQLPVLKREDKAIDFIKALDKTVAYSVPVTYEKEIWLQLCTLIQIFRPSVTLYLNGREALLLDYVASRLTPFDLKSWNEFYMISDEGVQVVDTRKPIYVQRLGYCDVDQAMAVASFVPTDFGRKVMKDVPVFRAMANECIRALNTYKNQRSVTLAELFR